MEIISAREMRQRMETDEYKREVKQATENQMKRIEDAANKGKNHTCFVVPEKYEDKVKIVFLSKGYTFKNTGYVGGV